VSGFVAPRRARDLSITELQLLWHRVVLDTTHADEAARAQLGLFVQHAVHPIAPLVTVRLRVEGNERSGYTVFDNDDVLAAVASPREVLDEVFARAHRRAFELASLSGWVRFHGAVVRVGDQRVVVVGDSGAGKTTLTVSLLVAGHHVETDESFVTREGSVLAVPRRFHVKPGTRARVPEAAWLDHAPVLDGDPPLSVVDPTEHGFEWTLAGGPVDRVVLLERAEGPSSVAAVGASVAVQVLIDQSFPVAESRALVVRRAVELVRGATTRRVVNGDDGHALDLLLGDPR
jgi:hypothetical protein